MMGSSQLKGRSEPSKGILSPSKKPSRFRQDTDPEGSDDPLDLIGTGKKHGMKTKNRQTYAKAGQTRTLKTEHTIETLVDGSSDDEGSPPPRRAGKAGVATAAKSKKRPSPKKSSKKDDTDEEPAPRAKRKADMPPKPAPFPLGPPPAEQSRVAAHPSVTMSPRGRKPKAHPSLSVLDVEDELKEIDLTEDDDMEDNTPPANLKRQPAPFPIALTQKQPSAFPMNVDESFDISAASFQTHRSKQDEGSSDGKRTSERFFGSSSSSSSSQSSNKDDSDEEYPPRSRKKRRMNDNAVARYASTGFCGRLRL